MGLYLVLIGITTPLRFSKFEYRVRQVRRYYQIGARENEFNTVKYTDIKN